MIKSIRNRRLTPWMVLLSLTLIVLAFAFAACGGDSGSSSSSSSNTSSSNSSSSSSKSVQTVNVKETKAASGDVYMCDPTSISIKKGDTVTFTNQSDENQDFDQGDAEKAGVDFVIGLNQSKDVTFNTAGTFTIKSEKGASITVTVQ